jgi:hypothetical protein
LGWWTGLVDGVFDCVERGVEVLIRLTGLHDRQEMKTRLETSEGNVKVVKRAGGREVKVG